MRAPAGTKASQSDRDATNPAVAPFDQIKASSQVLVDENLLLGASDEWFQITPSDGTASHRFVLRFDDNSFQYVDSEPFFVSGARRFRIQEESTGFSDSAFPLVVTRGKRREFFSASSTPQAANNTKFHSWQEVGGGLTPSFGAGEYVARSGAAGTPWFTGTQWTGAGFPGSLRFGWGAGVNSRRGRYYSADVSVSAPAGNAAVDLLILTPGIGPGYTRLELVPATAPLVNLVLSVGDDALSVVSSTPYAGAVAVQASVKTCVQWSLAYRHTAGVNQQLTVGEYIIRRGF